MTAGLGALRRAFARWLGACALVLAMPVWADAGIALYVSPTSKAYFPSLGGNYEAMVNPWRKLLSGNASTTSNWRELSSPAELAGWKGGVLILPSAVALNAAERQALLKYRDSGGSILATWAIGARDARGQWLGHDFSRDLLGVRVIGEIGPDAPTRFLIPYGDTPVNRSIPAGRRLWLGSVAEKPLQLKGGTEAAAYTAWTRSVLKTDDHHAAIVFDDGPVPGGPPTAGRRVVFGFAETAWDFHPADTQALAADALRWLARSPAAHLAAWPNGYRAAQVIEMDTEEGFANAIHFAELMEGINAAGTFYCLTSEMRKHGDLLRRLASRHELGFHGEVHLGFKGATREHQKRRLDRMLAEMKGVLGTHADGWPQGAGRGFRAPTEGYDDTTEVLLQAMGFRHHVADPDSSTDRLPFFSPVASPDRATGLVVLPRGQLDDLNYQAMNLSPEQVGAALIGEYEFNLRMSGLGLLSVHSQNFADPKQLLRRPLHNSLMTRSVEVLMQHIGPRHERAWIVPAGTVAQWWRDRARSTVTASVIDRQLALELTVAPDSSAAVSGLTVLVHPPAADVDPKLKATTTGSPLPKVQRVDRFTASLVFGALPPGRHRFSVTFP